MLPLLVPFLLLLPSTLAEDLYETRFLQVPLDHFSFEDNETFALRYLINVSSHVKGGPAFLYCGNEADVNTFARNVGFLFEIAPIFNALVVFAEHRYYGESRPFGNRSLEKGNAKYLSTSQVLADLVYLVEHLKTIYFDSMISNDTFPFVAFGGSYGGMLAAWLRMKYPNVVVGAVASSAPIWLFGDLTPCDDFYGAVTTTFRRFGTVNCTDAVKRSWRIVRNYTATVEGKNTLSRMWNLCAPLNTSTDVEDLLDWLADVYVELSMFNYPYPTDFLVPLPAYPVKAFCGNLTVGKGWRSDNDTVKFLEVLGKAIGVYSNYTGRSKCNALTDDEVRTWEYQACTELVMPMCSTEGDMFETEKWNLKKYSDQCFRKTGVRVLRPDWIISEYGGKNLRYFSNIVFVNGLADPWSVGCVQRNVTANGTVWSVNITDGVHHVDLRASVRDDADVVKAARKFVVGAVKRWLNMF